MIELLAPAGNPEKLDTAIYFGADAIYVGGKQFGLRAFTDNFDNDALIKAVKKVKNLGKKLYVTMNIFAFNEDFAAISQYAKFLQDIGVDAAIISDAGVFSVVKKSAPNLKIHISTQANTTNKYAAKFWADEGAERIVLARELNLTQIREIRDFLPNSVSLEAFVHGAMCISYSGRCLLSNYITGRSSNRGECAQNCRWEYAIAEKSRSGEYMDIAEDGRGTYILNSKDLNMLPYIDRLVDAGINSFKIEGRVKTAYYVANTVNAYRRAIDLYLSNPSQFLLPNELEGELYKSSHRTYFTGFYLGDKDSQNTLTSRPVADYKFCAIVTDIVQDGVVIEQRNRFKTGDELEILSPSNLFNKTIKIEEMETEDGKIITDALNVQQRLKLKTDLKLNIGDILRKL